MSGPRYVTTRRNPKVRHLTMRWSDFGRLCDGNGSHWFDVYTSDCTLPLCGNCRKTLDRLNREAS